MSWSFLCWNLPPTPVFVPAIYNENVTWASYHSPTFTPANDFRIVQYQRLDPNDDFYSPNKGDEAGVYLQYIAEHYDSLPDFSVFVQAKPWEHALHLSDLAEKARCLRDDVGFVSLNDHPSQHKYATTPQPSELFSCMKQLVVSPV
jgi:hypothetical protein